MESTGATQAGWPGLLRCPGARSAQEAAVSPAPSETSPPSHASHPSFPDSVWEGSCPLDSVARLPNSALLRLLLPLALFLFAFTFSPGCGLDWTLPQAHFEGVDEQGYVSYWEKIGEADLGDGLVIPVHINFNSHRESSSPTLGKGWMLPLLESHVEPVDENTMHVIMPDGWTFLFLRNGNTDTWRGNAGWVGQTDGARFTITAPCGWRVKFDAGKIQEIDTPKNRTITIKYNGPAPLEADIDNQPFVQVQQNTATGVAESITIGAQKIAISQAQRPRITTVLGKTLLTGFDPAVSQLQWPDQRTEEFAFGTEANLNPSLSIIHPDQTQRHFTWNPVFGQIDTDGEWIYSMNSASAQPNEVGIKRVNSQKQFEYYERDKAMGIVTETALNGVTIKTYTFTSGPLAGKIRKKEMIGDNTTKVIYRAYYNELGRLTRLQKGDNLLIYDGKSHLTALYEAGALVWKATYDNAGNFISGSFLKQ